MKILHLTNTNIFYNLAVEEFLLKNSSDDFFIIWQSENALVFGKHQNVFEEINTAYAIENKINLARRISGGGTVYHDLGNVNFSFILNKKEGKQIDFEYHTKPIFEYLKSLTLNVNYSDRHDIFIDKLKISGNAEHVFKNRVLHHGTLLYNTDLNKLEDSLFISKNKHNSKSIKSVSKKVTNISNYTSENNITKFISNLKLFVLDYCKISTEQTLSDTDILTIKNLQKNKFESDYWVFGYSPKFRFNNEFINNRHEKIKINIDVNKGIIINFSFTLNDIENNKINDTFISQKYYPVIIKELIEKSKLGDKFNINNTKLLYEFF